MYTLTQVEIIPSLYTCLRESTPTLFYRQKLIPLSDPTLLLSQQLLKGIVFGICCVWFLTNSNRHQHWMPSAAGGRELRESIVQASEWCDVTVGSVRVGDSRITRQMACRDVGSCRLDVHVSARDAAIK